MASVDVEVEIENGLNAHLVSLAYVTTGALTTISATSTGWARSSGSFITDGFEAGDWVKASGFSAAGANVYREVTAVTATKLTAATMTAETAGNAVTLIATVPNPQALIAWSGRPFTVPTEGIWVRPNLRPSGTPTVATGSGPYLRHEGIYLIDVLEMTEPAGGAYRDGYRLRRLAAKLRHHFRPWTQTIVRPSLNVRLLGVNPGAVLPGENSLQVPISVSYAADFVGY